MPVLEISIWVGVCVFSLVTILIMLYPERAPDVDKMTDDEVLRFYMRHEDSCDRYRSQMGRGASMRDAVQTYLRFYPETPLHEPDNADQAAG